MDHLRTSVSQIDSKHSYRCEIWFSKIICHFTILLGEDVFCHSWLNPWRQSSGKGKEPMFCTLSRCFRLCFPGLKCALGIVLGSIQIFLRLSWIRSFKKEIVLLSRFYETKTVCISLSCPSRALSRIFVKTISRV